MAVSADWMVLQDQLINCDFFNIKDLQIPKNMLWYISWRS